MFRFLLQLLGIFILLLAIRAVVRSLFPSSGISRRGGEDASPIQTSGELKRDPVCGAYVAASVSVIRKVNGETLHFCSKECSERYKS